MAIPDCCQGLDPYTKLEKYDFEITLYIQLYAMCGILQRLRRGDNNNIFPFFLTNLYFFCLEARKSL